MSKPNFHPNGGFVYPTTTSNVNGVVDYEALRAKNNRQKPKKNFFTKQIQKFGQSWIEKRTDQDLMNSVKDVLRDLVKGNFTEQDFEYFYNTKFSRAIRNGTFERLNYYYPLSVAVNIANDYCVNNGIQLPYNYKEVYDQQVILYNAYADLQQALTDFSALSVDKNAAISYLINFQNMIHGKYFYAVRCF